MEHHERMGRVLSVLVVCASLLLPAAASARSWHGLSPGVSTKRDVLKKFGSPTRELPMTLRYDSGITFKGKAATQFGAEEAQFYFDKEGRLTEIFVFPAVALKRTDVIKAYGTEYDERRTDDFRLYFHYRTDGFIIFFEKDNESVYQLQFTPAVSAPVKTATNDAPPAKQPDPTTVQKPPAVDPVPAP